MVSGGGKKVRRQTYDTDETSSDEDGRPKRSSTRTQNSKIRLYIEYFMF